MVVFAIVGFLPYTLASTPSSPVVWGVFVCMFLPWCVACEILVPWLGSNLQPLCWKCRVSSIGSPGSPSFLILFLPSSHSLPSSVKCRIFSTLYSTSVLFPCSILWPHLLLVPMINFRCLIPKLVFLALTSLPHYRLTCPVVCTWNSIKLQLKILCHPSP